SGSKRIRRSHDDGSGGRWQLAVYVRRQESKMKIPVKIMKKPNEQNACDAFITILKSLTDIEYVASESPDEVNRRTPDVDFVLVSSGNKNDKIAVEHTIVESFDEQIRYVKKSYDIVKSVNAGCRKRIPSGRY